MNILMSMFYIILTFNFIFENTVIAMRFGSSVKITLPQGEVQGSLSLINNYKMFLGIPYASVKHRFEEPGEPPQWNGTFMANRGSIICIQFFTPIGIPIGQEDCLVLNIFTPIKLNNKPHPVIIFLHGGGFYWGSNSDLIYNPRFLVKKNVIVVTVNYRLGAFGFLCLNHKEAPGNIGLKDQIAALKWIQQNIAYFGGDPNSVTLYGQSAGAASVNYLLRSPSAEGLFHRAIMSSGTALMPQAFTANPIEDVIKVASRLGYNTTNINELLKLFKRTSTEDLVRASHFSASNDALAPYIYKPCIEHASTEKNPVVTTYPRDLLKETGPNIPIIMGFNDKEGIYWAANYDAQGLRKLNEDFSNIIPNNLYFSNDAEKKAFMYDVKWFYFDNSSITTNNLIDYFSDSLIIYPTIATTNLIKKSNKNIYLYYFTYDSLRNVNKIISRLRTIQGASHGDELFYLFDPVIYQFLPNIPKDVELIERLTNLWITFAKTGKPTNKDITWDQDGDELKLLELGSEVKMINLPNKERIEFWKKAYDQYGMKKIRNGISNFNI